MNDIKINLTMLIPGGTLLSEQECLREARKPVIIKKGKFAGKQAKDKRGNLLWESQMVPDLTKFDKYDLKVESPEDGKEVLTIYTRKGKNAVQTINISSEAYDSFVSNEVPFGFKAPKSFKPYAPIRSRLDRKTHSWVEGTPVEAQAWKKLSPEQRLEWHLNYIASSLGGKMKSYVVFGD